MPKKRNGKSILTDAEKKRLKTIDEKIAKFNDLDAKHRLLKHHFFKLDIFASVKNGLLP
jgi:ATP-dependent helicase/DNAse subunit B